MSSVIAVVKSVVGQVIALSPEGVQRLLIEGDRLLRGEQVQTGQAGMVSLQLQDGQTLDLGRASEWLAVNQTEQPASEEKTSAPADDELSEDELQQAIAAGMDPTAELDATAAGPGAGTSGGGAGGIGGGHSFVLLDATAGQLDVQLGFATQAAPLTPPIGTTQDVIDTFTPALSAAEIPQTPEAPEVPVTENSAPQAVADSFTLLEDGTISGNLLGNDSDADGDALTVTGFSLSLLPAIGFPLGVPVSIPFIGTLQIDANGDFSFTPQPNYSGPVPSFTYTISDGSSSSSATLNFDITPVNDAPVHVVPEPQITAEDTPLTFSLLTQNALGAFDPDQDNLTTTLTVEHGVLNVGLNLLGATVSGDGTNILVLTGSQAAINNAMAQLQYTPNANYFGPDNLTISSSDGQLSVTDNIAITVTPVNDLPVAIADSITVSEGGTASILIGGATSVLANDSDIENSPLSAILVTGPSNGALTLNADGTFSYVHNGSETSTDSFTYKVNDGSADGNTVTVSINITPVNDAPLIRVPDAQTTPEDTAKIFSLATSNALGVFDPELDTLSVTLTVDHGILQVGLNLLGAGVSGDGTASLVLTGSQAAINNALAQLQYTPSADYHGPDVLNISASDGTNTVTDAVPITVTPVNDAPLAADFDASAVQGGAAITISLSGSDPDSGDAVEDFRITSLPSEGSLLINGVAVTAPAVSAGTATISAADVAAGGLTYQPPAGYDSVNDGPPPSFTYQAHDGEAYSAEATVTIEVADALPDAVDDNLSVVEGELTETVNLVIMLDTSTSMIDPTFGGVVSLPGGGTTTRLALAQEALENLINSYGGALQNVMLVSFNGTSTFHGWLSPSDAVDAIQGLSTGNGTDFDSALQTVQQNYGTPPDADHSYVYFLSDGFPATPIGAISASTSVSASERDDWVDFLASNNIDAAYAIGMGSDVISDYAQSNLDTVAWSPNGNPSLTWNSNDGLLYDPGDIVVPQSTHNSNTLVVADPLDLEGLLQGTLPVLEGGLLDGSISGSVADDFGADGAAAQKIVEVMLDSDGDGIGDIAASFDGNYYSLDLGAAIGTLSIDAHSGDYSFQPVPGLDVQQDTAFQVIYTIEDADGSRDSATLTLNILDSSEVQAYDNLAQATLTAQPSTSQTLANFSVSDSLLSNGPSSSPSASFDVTGGSASLSFTAAVSGRSNESFGYQLQQWNGSGWGVVAGQSGSLSNGSLTLNGLAAGTYRLMVTVLDNRIDLNQASASLSNLLVITSLSVPNVVVGEASGNLIADANQDPASSHAWGAVDSLGSEGALLSAIDGVAFSGSTTVSGLYGELTVQADGHYSYRPFADLGNLGASESFSYTLTQADGDSSTALLRIEVLANTQTTTPITGSGLLNGTATVDVLLGSSGADELRGEGANDHLEGAAGNDLLLGGDGADILIGGAGNDELWGGSGADTFIWHAGDTGADVLKDFDLGEDKIDLSDLLQGEENASDIGAYIQLDADGETLLISTSGNLEAGGGNADLSIQLEGVDLGSLGATPAAIINSLVAGADPTIHLDQ